MVAQQASHPARGLPLDANEICWCESSKRCTCDTIKSENKIDSARSVRRANEDVKQAKRTTASSGRGGGYNGFERFCGPKGCVNVLKVVGLGGMLVAFTVVAVVVLLHRPNPRGPQKDASLKRDSPATPDIPSVYDPESSGAFEGPDVKLLAMSGVDVRWEVRRDNLLFENLLGEGEFGKVVRAQAWSIAGRDGYSTVAVKMLKDNASVQDAQDLLQELQTLKEVDHVNVIKLLGACTSRDGPLYVIVEYCEFGSLRSYLRRCRNIPSIEDLRAVQNPTYLGEDPRTQLPSAQQLISFMWQIARGMSYLSDLKVIHRDLATRNILVAKGQLIIEKTDYYC
ncbi:proto-oncogene tyrosine-protein kinase receptor Ret-like [Tropilaelaps mercedesae]|uniref:Proto-oncogene tyrosine-protein kinase receptor Ret-like n=1 Tax=Tropilaelaps mercedesae TaxID=418985 RepID=A0A1V9Y2M4_9ACAR|nr:proto-oncogene tyrosine-protein kinase receptor Ret-like [Tropilaelaps mercedesae]